MRLVVLVVVMLTSCSDVVKPAEPWDLGNNGLTDASVDTSTSDIIQIDARDSDASDAINDECPTHKQGNVAFLESARPQEGDNFCADGAFYEVNSSLMPSLVADDCCGREFVDLQINRFDARTVNYVHQSPNGPEYSSDFTKEDCRNDRQAHFGEKSLAGCEDCENMVDWTIEAELEVENTGTTVSNVRCVFQVQYPTLTEKPYSYQAERLFDEIGPGETIVYRDQINSTRWGCGIAIRAHCFSGEEPASLDYRLLEMHLAGTENSIEYFEHSNDQGTYLYSPSETQ